MIMVEDVVGGEMHYQLQLQDVSIKVSEFFFIARMVVVNVDLYANFEYRTNSLRIQAPEIFGKQNGVSDTC